MSWRSACWGLALVMLGACNQKSADSESDGTLMTGPPNPTPGATPFPCEVGAALQRNCWSCHGAALDHAAPMHLTSWDDVQQLTRDLTEQIFQRIEKRVHDVRDPMPPTAICAPGGPCPPCRAWRRGAPACKGAAAVPTRRSRRSPTPCATT